MLTRNLSIINRYCHFFLRPLLEDCGLSGPDSLLLSFLKGREAANQDYLGCCLLLDKATVAKSAARLEERGFIRRRVNALNRREKLVELTDEGRALLGRIDGAKARWEDICLSGFDEAERAAFLALSERAAQNAVEYRGHSKEEI